MSETSGDNVKFKWTPEGTALLVSVWSDRQVQKQLEYISRPQVIWESVARYMKKKGYNVTGKQCRSRMKQVLVCYREAKRAGTRAGVEQYYETIDRVLKNKRLDHVNVGIDTVDGTVKSPPKDVKTNKNLRLKVQEPVQSIFRTEALSPTWMMGYENEYPDSPESNETIVAKPYRVFSPTRDVAINTGERFIQIGNRAVQTNPIEKPIREEYRQNILASIPYGEIPYQNAVQNVQNQIIQENMQQYQNIQQQNYTGWNHLPQQSGPANNRLGFQPNVRNMHQQYLANGITQNNVMQNPNVESIMRQQNQLHRAALYASDNRAMPQEPRKVTYAQNLTTHGQYQDTAPRLTCMANVMSNGSPDYSPDVSQNLNDAFCLSKTDDKTHNLNETYSRPINMDNPMLADTTVVTNNATCNDESLLLEFLLNSPTPSENGGKSRDSAVNTDEIPSAPFRKKKAQKLEQLVLNAINSQNEVVNKILTAQNEMVTRFLDVDRDRQNRLENRFDHLLNVVHATVLNKNEPSPPTPPPMPETAITSLLPPPKPGMIPPKLDLVPPKPCRVPCTIPNSNVELVNQNPILTRPGIVSPITVSPGGRKLGTIWSKLGPVSTSPFVKAQQRLGLQPVFNNDVRTKSSAERRIAMEMGRLRMDARSLMYETTKLLKAERELEEKIENARLELSMGQTLTARRKLFTQREPTPIMILTAAFLDTECHAYEQDPPYHGTWNSRKEILKYTRRDNLVAGQGESYERMRQLNAAIRGNYFGCEPCDSSTPAKLPQHRLNIVENANNEAEAPRQTIQQLARLVMNSARWRHSAPPQQNLARPTDQPVNQNVQDVEYNVTFTAPKANAPPPPDKPQKFVRGYDMTQQKQSSHNKAVDGKPLENDLYGQSKFPMGFTTTNLITNEKSATLPRQTNGGTSKAFGFVENPPTDRKNNVRFMDEALAELQRMYIERQNPEMSEALLPFMMSNGNSAISAHNRNLIERYVNDLISKKLTKDKDTDSDNDDEYLDTSTSMHPACMMRRGSLTSNGTASTETAHSVKLGKAVANQCRIS